MPSFSQNDLSSESTATQNDLSLATMLQRLLSGTNPSLEELASYTFESVVMADGTKLEDIRFDELVAAVWTQNDLNP